MELKPGLRLASTVCSTEVIVVKAPAGPVDLRCGGRPMVAKADAAEPSGTVDPTHGDGTLIGKRYADDELGIEVLCTKAGDGSLSIGAERLGVKEAKPLPSSD
ncbi:MAG TPA: hypothetical protein VG478_14445 [Acidimicrobiales bacterium]|jgi:hypothetical protein|nr:hypothetical protein [Acidimicrobiales bacterium]